MNWSKGSWGCKPIFKPLHVWDLLDDGDDIYKISGHIPKDAINLINDLVTKDIETYHDQIYNIVDVQIKTMNLCTIFLPNFMTTLPIQIPSLGPNQLPTIEQNPRDIHLPMAHQNQVPIIPQTIHVLAWMLIISQSLITTIMQNTQTPNPINMETPIVPQTPMSTLA